MKFKNYRNSKTDDNRIYTTKEIKNMTLGEIFRRKDEILAQNRAIGVPSESELRGSENVVYVHEYEREDGTRVRAHWRSKCGGGKPEEKQKDVNVTGGAAEIGNSDIVLHGGVKFNDFIEVVDEALGTPAKNAAEILETVKEGFGKALETGKIVAEEVEKAQNKEVDLSVKPAEISSPNMSNMRLKSHVKLTRPKSVLVNINNRLNKNYKDAKRCMNIALIEPENIENNADFKILTDNELRTMSNKMHFNIPEKLKTVQFSSDSSLAKSVQESQRFKDAVREWVETPSEQRPDTISLELSDNENLARSILHATIFNPRIENGVFKGFVYDVYDFKLQWFKDALTTFVNTNAVLLQTIKQLKNYSIIIPVEIEL